MTKTSDGACVGVGPGRSRPMTAVVALRRTLPLERSGLEDRRKTSLVRKLASLGRFDINTEVGRIPVSVSRPQRDIMNRALEGMRFIPTLLHSTLQFDFLATSVEGDYDSLGLGEAALEGELMRIQAQQFESILLKIALAANLASPGGFPVLDYVVEHNHARIELGSKVHIYSDVFAGARTAQREIGWPRLRTLDFGDALDWLNQQEGFCREIGGGRTGRAINALMHVLTIFSERMPETLLWSLIGIEALYARGSQSTLEQIRTNTAAVLGVNERARKQLSSLYQLRSRFIHGDLDFPGPLAIDYGDAEDWHQEMGEAADVALAVLIASVQTLARRKWSSFDFVHVARPGK